MFAIGKEVAAAGWGASPQAIKTGTARGARRLGLEKEIDSLQPGKRADLLAVTGDPNREIMRPREVRLVGSGDRVTPAVDGR
jgi:imidazolonepropionase-like amidohydrolase